MLTSKVTTFFCAADLRVIIRDINLRRYVTSDLNRAINAAFIEKGIEIPFPQRDVNFRGPLQVEPGSGAPPKAPDVE